MLFYRSKIVKTKLSRCRTVHLAHGYRNEGGREVGVKRVLVFMFHQFSKELFAVAVKNVYSIKSQSLKFVYSYSRIYSQNKNHKIKSQKSKYLQSF